MFIENCLNKYYRVCVLIKIKINVFRSIITFSKNQSDSWEIITVLIVASLLIAATGFCNY